MHIFFRALVLTLLGFGGPLVAEEAAYAPGGPAQCLGCHDFGPDSPVHPVMQGSHGEAIANPSHEQRGCEDCHGPSANHAMAPTQVAPGVSYGPRWSNTVAVQDQQCLNCHEGNIAKHWRDALHMLNDLTCVTCHDIHQPKDAVLFADTQAQVCTTCHKVQRNGMHGIGDSSEDNPACTSCHNPHDHENAVASMLGNRSEGCRGCHDLVSMAQSPEVSDKAKSYHKVMTQSDRTCLDCHQGIAHAAPDAVPPMLPEAASRRQVTLFYPGQATRDWLIAGHPGSQPLRQGRNCQQCHRGDEAALGAARGGQVEPSARDIGVSVDLESEALVVNLSWNGPASDTDIALMWGGDGNEGFRRGGCFAACHDDMPGMARDRGQQTGKYLSVSRAQEQMIGRPPIVKERAALDALLADGNFVELWQTDLVSGESQAGSVLDGITWIGTDGIGSSAAYHNGRWEVRISRQLGPLAGLQDFSTAGILTLGIALHGADNAGGAHWVSLPLTLSFGGDDTDLSAE